MRYFTIIFLLLLIACTSDEQVDLGPITLAQAEIYFVSTEDDKVYAQGEFAGNVSIEYQGGVTSMQVTVSDFEPNTSHAMHLHQGTLEEPSHHWNQNVFTAFCNVSSVGSVWAKPFAGDVGNIDIDGDGNGAFTISTDLWSLGTGEDSAIENTVLYIHESEEDFVNECDPNHSHNHGHVNAKIAGGTIILGEVQIQ